MIKKERISIKTVHVDTGNPYDIFIERGIIDNCGEYVKQLSDAKKVTVITDTNVAEYYLQRVTNSLEKSGFLTNSHIFRAGEESKNLSTIAEMYNTLADCCMTRKDIIVALGGGVTGDMAGFAAASYLRGIDFIQIPTSLLAQVDSSVGGKTGVDILQGKNLVGAFHQPKAVLIDPDTLKTLPDLYLRDGMAEVIKYGCIKDEKFFEKLENENAYDCIDDIIEVCVSIKRDVVSRDEREAGERMLLNFGHTLGHSIEKLNNFKGISHGMAVAVGMVLISRAGEKQKITEKGTTEKIIKLCEKYGLPTSDKATFEEMADAAKSDKKTTGGDINLVLLNKIGDSFTKKIELNRLLEFIDTNN